MIRLPRSLGMPQDQKGPLTTWWTSGCRMTGTSGPVEEDLIIKLLNKINNNVFKCCQLELEYIIIGVGTSGRAS